MSSKSKAKALTPAVAEAPVRMVQLYRFADRLITEPMPEPEADAVMAGYPGEYAHYPLADEHLIALGLAADPANQPAPDPEADGPAEAEEPTGEVPVTESPEGQGE